jgi:hypothetical protein
MNIFGRQIQDSVGMLPYESTAAFEHVRVEKLNVNASQDEGFLHDHGLLHNMLVDGLEDSHSTTRVVHFALVLAARTTLKPVDAQRLRISCRCWRGESDIQHTSQETWTGQGSQLTLTNRMRMVGQPDAANQLLVPWICSLSGCELLASEWQN